jgi:hypothetical protein
MTTTQVVLLVVGLVLVLVVLPICLLAGVGTWYMGKAIDEGNIAKAKADVKSITDAAAMFKAQHEGKWPANLDELYVQGLDGRGPYLKNVEWKLSPWGTPYVLDPQGMQNNGIQPDVYCVMPDGKKVVNWSRKLQ